jgi:transcriptional regulator with XRE-family HTH domain
MKHKTVKSTVTVQLDLKGVGRRIRELRGYELTQAAFGKVLGIGQTQLSKYEKGQSVPTLEFLVRLSHHTGKSLDWIVKGPPD